MHSPLTSQIPSRGLWLKYLSLRDDTWFSSAVMAGYWSSGESTGGDSWLQESGQFRQDKDRRVGRAYQALSDSNYEQRKLQI